MRRDSLAVQNCIDSFLLFFVSLPSQGEDSEGDLSQRLAKIDPEFYEFLQQNDSQLLEMSDDASSSGDHESREFDLSTDEEDLGTIEPRPLNITSRKHVREFNVSVVVYCKFYQPQNVFVGLPAGRAASCVSSQRGERPDRT